MSDKTLTWTISLAWWSLPYAVGLYVTQKRVPLVLMGASSPLVGSTVISGSELGDMVAVKGAGCLRGGKGEDNGYRYHYREDPQPVHVVKSSCVGS